MVIVPVTRPRVPNVQSLKTGVLIDGTVMGRFGDLCAHLEGWKGRRAAAHMLDWKEFDDGLTLENLGPPSSCEHWIPWLSDQRAQHVGLVIGYQAYSNSGDPPILTATLHKWTEMGGVEGVDTDGCEWKPSAGTLVDGRELVEDNLIDDDVYRYPIRYISTTARALAPEAIAGVTGPRVLNVGSAAAEILMVKLEGADIRVVAALVFEVAETLLPG